MEPLFFKTQLDAEKISDREIALKILQLVNLKTLSSVVVRNVTVACNRSFSRETEDQP